MSITGKDSLAEASAGVSLYSHTPSGAGATGGSWSADANGAGGMQSLASGAGFVGTGAATTCLQAGSTSAAPDYTQANCNFASDTYAGVSLANSGVGGPGGSNYSLWRTPGAWQVYKDGGVGTLGTPGASFSTSHNYLLRIERTVSGSTASITVYIDGVAYGPYTDSSSAYTTTMCGGLVGYNATAVTYTNYETGTISSSPIAGTLTGGQITAATVALTITGNSGGTSPYSNQLQRSPHGAATWSNIGSPVAGATANLNDTTAAAGTQYDYQVIVTDSASMTATSNTVTLTTWAFAPNNGNLIYYGRWNVTGIAAITINNGSECELSLTGNSCVLHFDTSSVTSSNYPVIAYWADGVGPTRVTLDSTGTLTVAFTYNDTGGQPQANAHIVRFMSNIYSGYPGTVDNWSSQLDAVNFLGGSLDIGASLLALPTSPNRIEFLGDSITASLRLLYISTDGTVAAAPEIGWPEFVSRFLGLRAIVNGHGGQGITTTSTDGAPIANTAFPYVYNGVAWSPTIQPIVVVIYQGTNDGSFTQGQYQTLLTTIRSSYNGAYIFAVNPHPINLFSTISAAVTAQSDARMFALDAHANAGIVSGDESDGLHLNPGGAVKLGAWMANAIQARLNTSGVMMQASGGGPTYFAF